MSRLLAGWFLLLAALPSPARDYHFDATAGDDAADGLTAATAWKSLDKFNATVFQPDDRALFKSGQRWTGQMRLRGSGSPGHPVTLGRYGEGGLPEIAGEGQFPAALLASDVEQWQISGLAVTNLGPATAPGRTGVSIRADKLAVMHGIALDGLHVHDVNGDLRKSHEGCGIFFEANPRTGAAFDGISIQNCKVERTDRNGICQRGTGRARSKNVVIRGNTLSDIGGDGIKLWGTDGGLIEGNLVRNCRARCEDHAAGIWPFSCDDTVIRGNEVSGTKGTKDGMGYDADYRCKRTLIENNYSHDNEGGFILVCSPGNSYNLGTIVRGNTSIHDGIDSARVIQIGGNPTDTLFENNTIVLGPGQNVPLVSFNGWDGGNAKDTRFTGNAFIVSDGARATYRLGGAAGTVFSGNRFQGLHVGLPADAR